MHFRYIHSTQIWWVHVLPLQVVVVLIFNRMWKEGQKPAMVARLKITQQIVNKDSGNFSYWFHSSMWSLILKRFLNYVTMQLRRIFTIWSKKVFWKVALRSCNFATLQPLRLSKLRHVTEITLKRNIEACIFSWCWKFH